MNIQFDIFVILFQIIFIDEANQLFNTYLNNDEGKKCLNEVFSKYDCSSLNPSDQVVLTVKYFNCYQKVLGIC